MVSHGLVGETESRFGWVFSLCCFLVFLKQSKTPGRFSKLSNTAHDYGGNYFKVEWGWRHKQLLYGGAQRNAKRGETNYIEFG